MHIVGKKRILWWGTQKPYETDEKMEMAKQDTTKTSFLTLSGSKISIVVTGIVPKPEGDYDVND